MMNTKLLSNFQYVTDLYLQGDRLKAKSQLHKLVKPKDRPGLLLAQPSLNPRVDQADRHLLQELI